MKKPQTLLDKAKEIKPIRLKINDEQIELALAWAKDEITYSQAQEALTGKRGGMTAYVMLARALRQHLQNNNSK